MKILLIIYVISVLVVFYDFWLFAREADRITLNDLVCASTVAFFPGLNFVYAVLWIVEQIPDPRGVLKFSWGEEIVVWRRK